MTAITWVDHVEGRPAPGAAEVGDYWRNPTGDYVLTEKGWEEIA